jgi:hypothetical protein
MKTLMLVPLLVLRSTPAWPQEVPADYAGILQSLGRKAISRMPCSKSTFRETISTRG